MESVNKVVRSFQKFKRVGVYDFGGLFYSVRIKYIYWVVIILENIVVCGIYVLEFFLYYNEYRFFIDVILIL